MSDLKISSSPSSVSSYCLCLDQTFLSKNIWLFARKKMRERQLHKIAEMPWLGTRDLGDKKLNLFQRGILYEKGIILSLPKLWSGRLASGALTWQRRPSLIWIVGHDLMWKRRKTMVLWTHHSYMKKLWVQKNGVYHTLSDEDSILKKSGQLNMVMRLKHGNKGW